MKKTILALLVTTAISCGLFSQAKADSISFNGVVTASGDSSTSSPTTMNFTNPWVVVGTPAPTGIFAGTAGSSVTMTNFTFTGDGSGAALSPNAPFVQWSFTMGANSYKFTLQSLSNMTTHNNIAGAGVGFATVNGVNYSGTWSMNGTSGTQFNFIVTTVPDGGSAIALLGVALTGIEGFRRVLRRRKA
jgi:protein with PEP-CTERM/exosortase system signal